VKSKMGVREKAAVTRELGCGWALQGDTGTHSKAEGPAIGKRWEQPWWGHAVFSRPGAHLQCLWHPRAGGHLRAMPWLHNPLPQEKLPSPSKRCISILTGVLQS